MHYVIRCVFEHVAAKLHLFEPFNLRLIGKSWLIQIVKTCTAKKKEKCAHDGGQKLAKNKNKNIGALSDTVTKYTKFVSTSRRKQLCEQMVND